MELISSLINQLIFIVLLKWYTKKGTKWFKEPYPHLEYFLRILKCFGYYLKKNEKKLTLCTMHCECCTLRTSHQDVPLWSPFPRNLPGRGLARRKRKFFLPFNLRDFGFFFFFFKGFLNFPLSAELIPGDLRTEG